jgi:hypothetical protein
MERNASIDLVLFDFDDTLVATAPRFERARNELFRLLGEQGFEEVRARALHHDIIDPEMRRHYGFGPHRLAHAFGETYARLCGQAGREPDPALRERCAALGRGWPGRRPPSMARWRRFAAWPSACHRALPQSGNARTSCSACAARACWPAARDQVRLRTRQTAFARPSPVLA